MFGVLSQHFVAWWLILSIGHAPIPWIHTHESLQGEELSVHLLAYHQDATDADPHVWHVHFTCLGMPCEIPAAGWHSPGVTSAAPCDDPSEPADEQLAQALRLIESADTLPLAKALQCSPVDCSPSGGTTVALVRFFPSTSGDVPLRQWQCSLQL